MPRRRANTPPISDFLDPGDRHCLEAARERASLHVSLMRDGWRDEAGEVVCAHCETMVRRGLMRRQGQYGTRGRAPGAAPLTVIYEPTEAALQLLAAVERIEALEAAQRPAAAADRARVASSSAEGGDAASARA